MAVEELSLFNRNDDTRLTERAYTNGNSQIKAINQILTKFRDGNKVVILHGGAGSGKSIIGLEVVRELGDGYITVPRIMHQSQYTKDYSDEESRVYMKDDRGIIKIQTLKGKANFKCMLAETPSYAQRIIESPESKFVNYPYHICNKNTSIPNKLGGCQHYVGISDVEGFTEDETYWSISGKKKLVRNLTSPTCHYHQQFLDALKCDIVILNSKKLESDCNTGRLPRKKVLVIDEFDVFLKELSAPKKINLSRMIKSLKSGINNSETSEDDKGILRRLLYLAQNLIEEAVEEKYNKKVVAGIYKDNVFTLDSKDTLIEESVSTFNEIFDTFMDKENSFLQDIKGLDSIYTAIVYSNISHSDTHLFYTVVGEDLTVEVFGLNVSMIVERIFGNFDNILLMSATKQKDNILKTFYGLNNINVVNTEETIVGTMFNTKLGCETSFKASKSYAESKGDRDRQLVATGEIIKRTESMTIQGVKKNLKRLFHTSAFHRLPTTEDMYLHESLKELGTKPDEDYDEDIAFDEFKDGNVSIHKSTKMFRAIDLPDDSCRAIIFQKLPFPMITPYYRAIGDKFGTNMMWAILNDECDREMIQGATRGIRNSNDWCFVCSPDDRVVPRFAQIFAGNKRVRNPSFMDGKISTR